VLGEHFLLQQRALRVELAQLVLRDPIGAGPVGAPALREDPGSPHHPVRVHAVDPDPELTELGSKEADLVCLIGFRRPVRNVVRPGEEGVLADDVDEIPAQPLVAHDPRRLARDQEGAACHDIVLEIPIPHRRLE
jgi:hypothetical protein